MDLGGKILGLPSFDVKHWLLGSCVNYWDSFITLVLVDIRNDELLFDRDSRELFSYNLRDKTVKEIWEEANTPFAVAIFQPFHHSLHQDFRLTKWF